MGFDALTYALAQKMGGGSSGGESMVTGQKIYAMVYGGPYDYVNVVFQLDNSIDTRQNFIKSYTLMSDDIFSYPGEVPWNKEEIGYVNFRDEMYIDDMSHWFADKRLYYGINYKNLSARKMVGTHANGATVKTIPNGVEIMYKTFCGSSGGFSNAVCPDTVREFSHAYEESDIGRAACGNNVVNMSYAYCGASFWYDSPVCGPNVVDMSYAYARTSFMGSGAIVPACGDKVVNMSGAYYQSEVNGSPVCGKNVVDMRKAYAYSSVTGSPVCGENVVNFYDAYTFCEDLSGSPVCGAKVSDMHSAYDGCSNLTGSPVCGDNVTDMMFTYRYCSNLTGSPVCGPNVDEFGATYHYCSKLTGSPVCGDNVINMDNTYCGCSNLTGSPVCGPNVTNMSNTYCGCLNLTGSPVCGSKVTAMYNTYANCYGLKGNSYFYSASVINVKNCFYGCTSKAINIYVKKNTETFNTLMRTGSDSIYGTTITWTDELETNGRYRCNKGQICVYPVDDVEAARIANGD